MFIISVLSFVVLVGIGTRVTGVFMHEGWQNPGYYERKAFLFQHGGEDINCLFFGSSRTLTCIDPILFDSLNDLYGCDTRSFVMANSSSFVNETLWHASEMIFKELKTSDIKYVFIEVDGTIRIPNDQLYKPRTSYFISPSRLPDFFNWIWSDPGSFHNKVSLSGDYLLSAIIRITEFGWGSEKIRTLTRQPGTPLWIERHGHRPMDPNKKIFQKGGFLRRQESLKHDTTQVAKTFQQIVYDAGHPESLPEFNDALAKSYVDLHNALHAEGITMVCVLPIRKEVPPDLRALFNALPLPYKIDMGVAASIVPELRRVSSWFDPGHLNNRGAEHYTRVLSHQWQNICSDTVD